jgi:hypothetical protein
LISVATHYLSLPLLSCSSEQGWMSFASHKSDFAYKAELNYYIAVDNNITENISQHVMYEIFTAVIMENAVFWDATPRDSCKNRRLGGTCSLHHHGDKNQRARNNVSSN